MNGGGQRQMVERDIAKLKSLQTLAGFQVVAFTQLHDMVVGISPWQR